MVGVVGATGAGKSTLAVDSPSFDPQERFISVVGIYEKSVFVKMFLCLATRAILLAGPPWTIFNRASSMHPA